MKYIRTPTGDEFEYDDCEIYEREDRAGQEKLADVLFAQTGILIAEEGGENQIEK